MRWFVAFVFALIVFTSVSTDYEMRCFLHCHNKLGVQVTTTGWPAAYWIYEVMPGDPPMGETTRFAFPALMFDVMVFGLLLSGMAIVEAAVRPRKRLRLRL